MKRLVLGVLCALLGACATTPRDAGSLEAQVTATEQAFAKTMADRDFAAFQKFVAPDAVFLSGPQPLRGAAAVGAYWKQYFATTLAPFSWQPDLVSVLASGTLALSSGPVHDAAGQPLGRFDSIWRRDGDGKWRIVFDKGEDQCRCAATH
jgi:ketosteroid isomerase-like protein